MNNVCASRMAMPCWNWSIVQYSMLTWFQIGNYQLWGIVQVQFSSVQSFSRVRLFATPWITARQASLSITNSRSLSKPMPIELVMPSSHLILCCHLLLLPPIPLSNRVFSNESTLHEVDKVLEFQPQHQSFQWTLRTHHLQDGPDGFSRSPRGSQEPSPTP